MKLPHQMQWQPAALSMCVGALGNPLACSTEGALPAASFPSLELAVPNAKLVDFDGDGRLDLLQTSRDSSAFGWMRGDGFGGFLPLEMFIVAAAPESGPVVLDLEGDGDLDAVAISTDGRIVRLLATGSGTYTTSVDGTAIAQIANADSLTLGDLDGDGMDDLIVVSQTTITTLLRSLGGSFNLANSTPKIQTTPQFAAAVDDVDSDGLLDVVSRRGTDSIEVHLGNAQYGFTVSAVLSTSHDPRCITIDDVDADGDRDIVYGGSQPIGAVPAGVAWFRNQGTGSFDGNQEIAGFPSAIALALADLNGNGTPELLATDFGLLRVGVDAFASQPGPTLIRPAPYRADTVFAARMDGDSLLDVVLASGEVTSISSVLRGRAANLLEGDDLDPIGVKRTLIAVDDVDADGDGDVLSLEGGSSSLRVLLNDGSGSFSLSSPVATGFPASTTHKGISIAADLDQDSDLDVIMTGPIVASNSTEIRILRAQSGGSFNPEFVGTLASMPLSIATGRFNGDTIPDIALADFLVLNSGIATFSSVSGTYSSGFVSQTGITAASNTNIQQSNAIAALDVDHDGFDDLAALVIEGTPSIRVFRCNGNGTFSPHQNISLSTSVAWEGIVAADVDGDSRRDLVLAPSNQVLQGLAAGLSTVPTAADPLSEGLNGRMFVADYDQDGIEDIVATSRLGNTADYAVCRSRGDLGFAPTQYFLAPGVIGEVLVADIDGNGLNDAICSNLIAGQASGANGLWRAYANCSGRVGRFVSTCSPWSSSSPTLSLDGCLAAEETVTLALDSATGANLGIVLFGATQANVVLPSGCVLGFMNVLPVSIALPVSSAGTAFVSGLVRPGLSGLEFYVQMVLGPSLLTNALALRVGS